MAQVTYQPDVPPAIERKLAQVRRGIRATSGWEGLSAIAIAVGAAFWIGLWLDWMFEPAPAVRLAAMIGTAGLGLWVAYRYLLRRAFVRLPDASLAVLLERHFTQLKDDLLTAVDLAAGEGATAVYHPELLTRTRVSAAAATANLNPGELFHRGPLRGGS